MGTEVFLAPSCKLNAKVTKGLCYGLTMCQRLRSLDLSNNEITNSGCTAIMQMVRRGLMVKRISLANNLISSRGTLAISEAFRFNNACKFFDISSNCIGPKGLARLRVLKVPFLSFDNQYPFLAAQDDGTYADDMDSDEYDFSNRKPR